MFHCTVSTHTLPAPDTLTPPLLSRCGERAAICCYCCFQVDEESVGTQGQRRVRGAFNFTPLLVSGAKGAAGA